jgi:hypothetical protein
LALLNKFHKLKGVSKMAKLDVIAAQLQALKDQALAQGVALITDALGAAYDGGAKDQAEADGSGTSAADQAKLDELTAKVADLQGQLDAAVQKDADDVKAGQDALAAVQAQMADVQKQLEEALAAKTADEAVIQGLQASASQLEALLGQLKAIVFPV